MISSEPFQWRFNWLFTLSLALYSLAILCFGVAFLSHRDGQPTPDYIVVTFFAAGMLAMTFGGLYLAGELRRKSSVERD